jgi:hypothetical protein
VTAADKITPKLVLSLLRKYSAPGRSDDPYTPLWVVQYEQRKWLLTGHFAFRPHAFAALAIEQLWKECNLPLEPMRVEVGLAVTRVEGKEQREFPDIASFIPDDKGVPMESRPLALRDLILEDADSRHVMWRRGDGAWSSFLADFAHLVLELAEPGQWRQGGEYSPATCWSDYGDLCALLTPVRIEHDGRLFRDPDLPPALFDIGDLRRETAPTRDGAPVDHGRLTAISEEVVRRVNEEGALGPDVTARVTSASGRSEAVDVPTVDLAPCGSDDHFEQLASHGNCAVCEANEKLGPDPLLARADAAIEAAATVVQAADAEVLGKPKRTRKRAVPATGTDADPPSPEIAPTRDEPEMVDPLADDPTWDEAPF